MPVVAIGSSAFASSTVLTNVTIPGSIKTIGYAAFSRCSNLTNVTILNGTTTIGAYAFNLNTRLINVRIPASLTTLSSQAFYGCSALMGAYFDGNPPASVGANVFFNANNSLVYYLASTTGWGSTFAGRPTMLWDPNAPPEPAYPFNYVISSAVATITAYTGTTGIVTIPSIIGGRTVASIANNAFANGILTNVTLPGTLTNIGSGAFRSCYGLTNITLGSNLLSIGSIAFDLCTNLAGIMIPARVTSLGEAPFYRCVQFASIPLDPASTNFACVDGVLFNKNLTSIIEYPAGKTGSYTIPVSVTNICNSAFSTCAFLQNITVNGNITSLGDYVFLACSGLGRVTLLGNITNIGIGSFHSCSSLTNFTITGNITSIGDWAFYNCGRLNGIRIPAGVTNIGNEAFSYCNSLTALDVDPGNAVFSSVDGLLLNKGGTLLIQCPAGKAGAVSVPGGVASIMDSAFINCTNVNAVTMPVSLTRIGNTSFYGCSGLTNVTILGGVTNIGNQAFEACTNLSGVYFMGDAPAFGTTIFNNDNKATVFYIPGMSGWGSTFATRPTALWYQPKPWIMENLPGFGVRSNRFGFTISWATNYVVVEGCTNLSAPAWLPVSTNAMENGLASFSDPQWTNHPMRLYRVRSR
jgi:hypothetical protein